MSDSSLSQDLYGFAVELRRLAYTMPGGHEDPLILLSERMGRHAGRSGILTGDHAAWTTDTRRRRTARPGRCRPEGR